jgi:hypothetical protein
MALDFISPSMRAAGSDLTIAVSPLGLIELSDEEFEVHGPRLTRYANAAAFYLGHHWAYRRAPGEPQLTANYVSTFSDYLTNFTFSRPVMFKVDPMFTHITPALLDRIWNQDNRKNELLWGMGNLGSVYGDVFVKVAYEPAYENEATGEIMAGRVRILPLNPSFCFPEWHPHDKDRLLRFKLKYRFWATSPEGTRMVNTYVEILTDQYIEEYINDELIDRRPNPLGFIPVVHIPNKPVAASPWGLSDIIDIIPLNRTFNELATDILDIINYHVAPVTIITGAKASSLEMGANKVWAIPQKDARVENLTGGVDGLGPAIEFMSMIKLWMHEITGVPQTALGQEQQISNTSGVALAIQYMPTMQKYNLKVTQYGNGIRKISQMALRTLFLFEPEQAVYNDMTQGIMTDVQQPGLNPEDPQVYNIECVFPPPLPQDQLVVLNEIQAELMLGIESKEGALRKLGEQFPDEKLQELFREQLNDTKMDAAKRILMTQIDSMIIALTGIVPEGAGTPVDGGESSETTTRKPDGTKTTKTTEKQPTVGSQATGVLPQLPGIGDITQAIAGSSDMILRDLVTQAFGTKLAQRRIPSANEDSPGYDK